MNYLDRLPRDLQFHIAEYVPSKPDRNLPYINEFKNVVTDWYNRYRVWGSEHFLRYDELYLRGILSHETQFVKYRFFHYAKEKKHYRMVFSPQTKKFEMIPFRNPLS